MSSEEGLAEERLIYSECGQALTQAWRLLAEESLVKVTFNYTAAGTHEARSAISEAMGDEHEVSFSGPLHEGTEWGWPVITGVSVILGFTLKEMAKPMLRHLGEKLRDALLKSQDGNKRRFDIELRGRDKTRRFRATADELADVLKNIDRE